MNLAYNPALSHFDINLAEGQNGELFVDNICEMLGKRSGEIEVKTDHKFIETRNLYVEYRCLHRDGIWRPSGIAVTKAKLWAFVWGRNKPRGMLPAVLFVETSWLKRATLTAWKNPLRRVDQPNGENPTKGILVTIDHIVKSAGDANGR